MKFSDLGGTTRKLNSVHKANDEEEMIDWTEICNQHLAGNTGLEEECS